MFKMMPTCKEVSERVSRSLDEKLTLRERIGVWMHLSMCGLCSMYNKQLDLMNRMFKSMPAQDSKEQPFFSLSEEARENMKKAVKDNMDKTE